MVYAHGWSEKADPDALDFHGPNFGKIKVDFFVGQAIADDLPLLHGSLMSLAFAFCMCFGLFVARYKCKIIV